MEPLKCKNGLTEQFELAGGTYYKGSSYSLSAFYPVSYQMLRRVIEGRAKTLVDGAGFRKGPADAKRKVPSLR